MTLRCEEVANFEFSLNTLTMAGVFHFIIYFAHIKRSFCTMSAKHLLVSFCVSHKIHLYSFLFRFSFGYGIEHKKLYLNRFLPIDFQQTYFMLIRKWIATINCCDVQHAQQNINQLGYGTVLVSLQSMHLSSIVSQMQFTRRITQQYYLSMASKYCSKWLIVFLYRVF